MSAYVDFVAGFMGTCEPLNILIMGAAIHWPLLPFFAYAYFTRP